MVIDNRFDLWPFFDPYRQGRDGELYLDGNDPIVGQSEGFLQMLNVKGRLYLGK